MSNELSPLLSDLAGLVGRITPADFASPTPCADYDVKALRGHVLGWLHLFTVALTDPDATEPRPDPLNHPVPDSPAAACSEVEDCAKQVSGVLADGLGDRSVRFLGDTPLPAPMVLGMLTAEVLVHGWDLARATGQTWAPSATTCEATLAGMRGMLTPEFRGPGQGFAAEVAAADDAAPLVRLVAFTGRDPGWTPPTPVSR